MTRYTSSFDVTRPFSDTCAQLSLTVGSVLTYTVPGDGSKKYSILFEYASDSNIYVGYNATPAAATADSITLAPNVEYKPEARYAIGGDVISFVTPDATAWMGISLRFIPN